jgi:hypothetical protein
LIWLGLGSVPVSDPCTRPVQHVAHLKLLSLLRPKFSAVPQILLLSPRRPSYRRAAPPIPAPLNLAGSILLRRSSLVWYCSAIPRWFGTAPPFAVPRWTPPRMGTAGRAGRRTTPIKPKKEEWTGRAEVQARPRAGRNHHKQVHRGKRPRARHTNHPSKYTAHIIIFWLSSWPHVNNLGFCLEILNNAIIAALVDISLPSNPEDMLCFMLSSTLICQVVYLLNFFVFLF